MSTRYSVGQMNQLGDALEAAGYSVDDVTKLRTSSVLKAMKDLWSNTSNAVIQPIATVLSTIKTFDPVIFISKGWKVLNYETDKLGANLTEVDFNKMVLETCLKEGETSITGEEKLKRLKEGSNARLGLKAFLALWEEKDHATLEWLYKEKGVAYLDFFGDILEYPDGERCVLCLCRGSGGGWDWRYCWLGVGWDSTRFSASLTFST